jgi:hypothetical protein
MKIIFVIILLALSGCATVPYCKQNQTNNCRKIGAGEMGGTVRGFYEEVK